MAKIRILDTHTANRIAAGEVVERPASIAKELIENSIDAGATAVTVEIREGGIDYLRVTDNGAGIRETELKTAFERHATSKIRSGDPLDSIGTLGFRGEALPSIASVARVEMISRVKGAESGARILIEGGATLDLLPAGSPEGTTFVVKDLFFNTPARRKFLKRPGTEGGYVGDVVLQQALAHPEISFRLLNNGKTVYHTPGNGDFKRALEVLLGREIAAQLLDVSGSFAGCTLTGAVGLQDAARANRQHEFFFVNGRFVRSPLMALALEEAVRGRIAIGRYPTAALYLTLPNDAVDVNVHPNKLEVRFRDENAVRSGLIEAILESLSREAEPSIPLFSPKPPEKGIDKPRERVEGMSDVRNHLSLLPPAPQQSSTKKLRAAEAAPRLPNFNILDLPPLPPPPTIEDVPPQREPPAATVEPTRTADIPPTQPTPKAEPISLEIPKEPPRILGTIFLTYALAQQGDELLIIDQHAAHERLLYDRFMEQLSQSVTQSQGLLIPYQFTATPAEAARLMEELLILREMGFEIDEFGENTFRVDAVPHILGEPQLKDFILELLGSLDRLCAMKGVAAKRDNIARMACKRAVKAGDALTREELAELMKKILDEKTPLTCPHGRPILLRMTRAELERRFRRVQ